MKLNDVSTLVRKSGDWLFYVCAASIVVALISILFPETTYQFNVREVNNTLVMDAPSLAREYAEKVTVEDSKPLPQEPISRSFRVPILMYHHVGMLPEGSDSIRADLTVSPELFEQQVAWLHNEGFTSITLEQVYSATQGKFVLPKKPVVFTFDDGYADVFEIAIPILKKYGYVGSFAVVPGFLESPEYASWEEVSSARHEGMEIISHTYNHFDGSNPKFSKEFIKTNLELSLRELDSRLGGVPRILIYPYGHYTPAYIEAAKDVGFVMALTVHFGTTVNLDNLMLTPRVRIHGNQSMDAFAKNVAGQ